MKSETKDILMLLSILVTVFLIWLFMQGDEDDPTNIHGRTGS
jgi:hypothetical protein